MLRDTRNIAFIGGGVMGEALVRGVLHHDLIASEQIIVGEPRDVRRKELAERYAGVRTTASNEEAIHDAKIIVFAIKPQTLPKVSSELKDKLPKKALLLSIIAGARIKNLQVGLGHGPVVRAMPNTPAQIGEGMTVWTASADTTEKQVHRAQVMLQALGDELFMEDEVYLDMATALSGTGPAYVFLFMEALIDAGVHLGFPRWVAERLVKQTMKGSVDFAIESDLHPAILRNMVTSPGGTSAEALYQLGKGGMRTIVSRAIWAAYQKSKYLGDLSER